MPAAIRVFVLHNSPAPYRMPVCEAVGLETDLTVYFCEGHDPERDWHVDVGSATVEYVVALPRRLPGRLTWDPALRGFLRRNAFDVYIASDTFTHAPAILTTWWAAYRKGAPFVMWCEAIDTAYWGRRWATNAVRRWIYARSKAFLSFSSRTNQFLQRRGAPADRILPAVQVVPAEQLPAPSRDRRALGLNGKAVVLYVGAFSPRKGVSHLIEAFRRVAGPEAVLVLVGSGPDEGQLRRQAADDRRIRFIGFQEGRDKTAWYAAADIFVLPTLHDPWGLVINEAMAFGLPVIVTDAAGCVPDIVRDGENGLVVPPGDPEALAAALARLLHDEALRCRMGQRSREIVRPYTTEAAARGILDVTRWALNHR